MFPQTIYRYYCGNLDIIIDLMTVQDLPFNKYLLRKFCFWLHYCVAKPQYSAVLLRVRKNLVSHDLPIFEY